MGLAVGFLIHRCAHPFTRKGMHAAPLNVDWSPLLRGRIFEQTLLATLVLVVDTVARLSLA
ncbi:hypothetical protein E2C01_041444 [Portunus trituberculatus]|uniref:Uncharacterized protein n=1 Tax=Portunus trituberculatus TaxID=210409 RepID=A0A5B7FJ98_PORTR|nr:hypothetical protein [Portunus trituberculatus]